MANETVSAVSGPAVEPRYRGYWVHRKWYCDCLLEAKCRQIVKEDSELLGKKCMSRLVPLHSSTNVQTVWSCPKTDRTEQCEMFMLDEDVRKARDWLAQYGPETPDLDLFQRPKRARPTSPRTPPAKLGININPFTRAKTRPKRPLPQESSDDWQQAEVADDREGRASYREEIQTDVVDEGLSSSASGDGPEESDIPPAKRLRHSPTTPVPDAPKKKTAHVSFVTPTAQTRRTVRNLNSAFEAARKDEAQPVSELPYPVNSLPTPETGHRSKNFQIYEDKDDTSSVNHPRIDEITSSLLAQLSSPINLDDSDSEGYVTPTKRSKSKNSSRARSAEVTNDKGKGKAKPQTNETSQNLITAIMEILRSEGHSLKASTRYQIEHEIESVIDIKDAQIQSGERTMTKLRKEMDQLEETIELLTGSATVNGVIELSD